MNLVPRLGEEMPILDSLNLDLNGWKSTQRDETSATWIDDLGDVLALDVFRGIPDIPPPSFGVEALRSYFRSQCEAPDSGIVEVDVVSVSGVPCAKAIVKFRMQPTGFTFQGACVIPKRDFSFVIRLMCDEHPPTGYRECAVMVLELPVPEYEPDPFQEPLPKLQGVRRQGRIKGWFKDPYDPQYDTIAICTLADDAKYDPHFPMHPLSRVRRKIDLIIQNARLGNDILATPNHGNYSVPPALPAPAHFDVDVASRLLGP